LPIILFIIGFTFSYSHPIIINHNCAKLEHIPESAILQARNNLQIAYGHTSHRSQLTEGMKGLSCQTKDLVGYKGDNYCWEGNIPEVIDKKEYSFDFKIMPNQASSIVHVNYSIPEK